MLAKSDGGPNPAPPAEPFAPPVNLPPDPANLDGLMESIARENPPGLTFLHPGWRDPDQWKQTARPKFQESLCYHPTS